MKCAYCNHLFEVDSGSAFKDGLVTRVRIHQNRCKYSTPEERKEWIKEGRWPRKRKKKEKV